MCKVIFDKNNNYSVNKVAEELHILFPTKSEDSIYNTITKRFKNYIPVNDQKRNRVFGGKDCQEVFNHFYELYSKKTGQMSIDSVSSSKERLHVDLMDRDIISELTSRARIAKKSRSVMAEEILKQYFSEHPFDRYEHMSREELIEKLRKFEED